MRTDCLVIGSGIAGLTYALDAAQRGSVLIITKDTAFESNTQYAQGGIAAVLGEDDSFAMHVQDTIDAGAGLCHREAVEQIVREGPQAVHELMQRGVAFTRARDAELDLGREGGHSRSRVAHATDITGREIVHALLDAIRREPRIALREYFNAVDLIIDSSGRCIGAHVLERPSGAILAVTAGTTMLCTGGAGQVYLHTTNPSVATGDGLALAYRAGANLSNMEFMQFHPTMFAHPRAESFLISEAVRGFGAKLVNAEGVPFMKALHPMGSLAPRDVVAQAIHEEMVKRGAPCVYLDIRTRSETELRDRFPHIYAQCAALGIHMDRDLIPVVPAAHYMCGGVTVDLEGRTNIAGLYACGEVACTGAHGANRLASNSLLAGLVYARHSAEDVRQMPGEAPDDSTVPAIEQPASEAPFDALMESRDRIRRTMWENVGIFRTDAGLARAHEELSRIARDVVIVTRGARITTASMEVQNLLTVARLIVHCAAARTESRGTHSNADHPELDNVHWKRDSVVNRLQFPLADFEPRLAE